MLVLQDCIEKLSAFKHDFGRQFGITKLGIFGSVARQENSEDSDIDIVVEVEKPTLSLMYELKEMLKSVFNCEVDLVRFRPTLRPLFRSNILNDVVYVGKRFDHKESYPEIPWQAIYGMRNIISHEYGNIDETIVVSVINDDLPKLKAVIKEILSQYNNV